MADSLTIRKIIERLSSGDIRIPAFQRGYIWESDQVGFLLDSIYKGFPIGIIFLWKTDVPLKTEKNLGRFELPVPRKDYPVNYVLDGQQRITSLFSVFQTVLTPVKEVDDNEWVDIYFDIEASADLQNSCFVALKPEEVEGSRYFPMNALFDSVAYRKATEKFEDKDKKKLDKLQDIFKEALIPIQEFETDDRSTVAIVFERINRAGVELDIYQLLSAWSWSEDFDLQERFNELSGDLLPFGFDSFRDDKDLQLKCCSGVILQEASVVSIFRLNGSEVRKNFEKIENGIKACIDFLHLELYVYSLEFMPFPTMMIPLVVFFASDSKAGSKLTHNQRNELVKWFWRSLFSRRYSAGVNKKCEEDIREVLELKKDPKYRMKKIEVDIDESFFNKNKFNVGAANTKSFILMLAQYAPKSFISGSNVILRDVLKRANRNEFHHIFPKKHLEKRGYENKTINCLSNMCFMSNADNQKIKDKAPAEYKKMIPSKILKNVLTHAVCAPESLDQKYEDFLKNRSALLLKKVYELIS